MSSSVSAPQGHQIVPAGQGNPFVVSQPALGRAEGNHEPETLVCHDN